MMWTANWQFQYSMLQIWGRLILHNQQHSKRKDFKSVLLQEGYFTVLECLELLFLSSLCRVALNIAKSVISSGNLKIQFQLTNIHKSLADTGKWESNYGWLSLRDGFIFTFYLWNDNVIIIGESKLKCKQHTREAFFWFSMNLPELLYFTQILRFE